MAERHAVAGRVGLTADDDDLEQARRLYYDVKDALDGAPRTSPGRRRRERGHVTRQERKAAAFRALHEDEPFVIPNPWDAGSARMLAQRSASRRSRPRAPASRSRSDESTAT